MVCHSDCQYLYHSSLLPAIIDFLSQSDENSTTIFTKKSGSTILANLPVFEIVFAANIVLYHHCCAALSCTATPVQLITMKKIKTVKDQQPVYPSQSGKTLS